MSFSLEASIGAGIHGLVNRAQRALVGAREKEHTDRRGRVTPYLEFGAPKDGTLVWLHGFSDEPDNFLRAAPFLARRYRLVIPAMPGFANGFRVESERYTFEAYGGWLTDVLGAIAGDRFHLMGNSLGGATALLVADALGPSRVRSLTLVNSGGLDLPGVRSVNDEMRAGHNLFLVHSPEDYRRFMTRVFSRPPYIPRPVVAWLARQVSAEAAWFARVASDLVTSQPVPVGDGVTCVVDLAKLRVPTLVLWGDGDTLFPMEHARCLARLIPGARLDVLEGIGHCPHLEAPRRLARGFDRFARSLPGAAP